MLSGNLNASQAEIAAIIAEKMSDQFRLVSREAGSVGLITVNRGPDDQRTDVMYTGGTALYRGSWEQVHNNDFEEWVKLDMGGELVDTRGMTLARYKAFIDQARESGGPLPDSREMAEQEGGLWTATLLTGENPIRGKVRAARIVGGEIKLDEHNVNKNSVLLGFRPVVGALAVASRFPSLG